MEYTNIQSRFWLSGRYIATVPLSNQNNSLSGLPRYLAHFLVTTLGVIQINSTDYLEVSSLSLCYCISRPNKVATPTSQYLYLKLEPWVVLWIALLRCFSMISILSILVPHNQCRLTNLKSQMKQSTESQQLLPDILQCSRAHWEALAVQMDEAIWHFTLYHIYCIPGTESIRFLSIQLWFLWLHMRIVSGSAWKYNFLIFAALIFKIQWQCNTVTVKNRNNSHNSEHLTYYLPTLPYPSLFKYYHLLLSRFYISVVVCAYSM